MSVPAPDLEMFPDPESVVLEPRVNKREVSAIKLAGPPATRLRRPPAVELRPVIVRLPFSLFLKVAFPLIVIVRLLSVLWKVPLPAEMVQAAKVPPVKLYDGRSLAKSVPPMPMNRF